MHEQLTAILASFDDASRRLHALTDRLTPDQAAERRDQQRWSIAENIVHLNLTSEAFLPRIEEALTEAGRLGKVPAGYRYRRDFFGWLLSMLVGPQWRIARKRLGSVKTPPAFVPEAAGSFDHTVAEFDRLQGRLVALVRAADGLPLDRVRIVSPFDARVRYNLYSTFEIIPRHELRHIVHMEGATRL